jgi:hypothetical protein
VDVRGCSRDAKVLLKCDKGNIRCAWKRKVKKECRDWGSNVEVWLDESDEVVFHGGHVLGGKRGDE